MILSDKYIITEDTMQITLTERYLADEKVDGELTGNKVQREKVIGYWSNSATGRKQLYNKMLNLGISQSEKQGIQEILDIVQKMSDQVEQFWSGNDS